MFSQWLGRLPITVNTSNSRMIMEKKKQKHNDFKNLQVLGVVCFIEHMDKKWYISRNTWIITVNGETYGFIRTW